MARGHLGSQMPFTDKQVAALKPKPERYEKKEPGRTGLGIRVTPKGRKSWTFVYRYGGKQKRMVFGTYPRMGLADAHIALDEAKKKLEHDVDPGLELAEEREAERNSETVADLVDEYLERHARKVMKTTSAREDERQLNREVVPEWGQRRAKDITRRDIIKLLDRIEDRGSPVHAQQDRRAVITRVQVRYGPRHCGRVASSGHTPT